MNLKKAALSIAVATTLSTAITAPVQAAVIDMNFAGLFTMLDASGNVFQNTSYPYYGDTTWGYGMRTQISGTLSFDTDTGSGSGSGTVNPFVFFSGVFSFDAANFQTISGGLMLADIQSDFSGVSSMNTQFVLDAFGLLAEIDTGISPAWNKHAKDKSNSSFSNKDRLDEKNRVISQNADEVQAAKKWAYTFADWNMYITQLAESSL